MEPVNLAKPATTRKTRGKKKYLGDPKDPHFIPSSPIISRQSLSLELEEELARSCTLVLSEVPHTDDEEEDPLMKYVTGHLAPIQTRVRQPRDKSETSQLPARTKSDTSSKMERCRSKHEDMATRSEASKRDTVDQTNTSTPLTMLSEAGRRSSNPRHNSTLRNKVKSGKTQAVYAVFDKDNINGCSWKSSIATQSTTALSSSQSRSRQQPLSSHSAQPGTGEFNKSLPSLPRYNDPKSAQKQGSSISQILKTIKRRRPETTAIHVTVTELSPVQRAQTVPITETSKKHKSILPWVFGRRRQQQSTPLPPVS